VRVKWGQTARQQLKDFKTWLSTIEGANPKRTIARIKASGESLERFGDIGRPSRFEGFRELSVNGAPYVIVFNVRGGHFLIVAVYHTAQDR
jgi:plasmid stabilization system protein ParE